MSKTILQELQERIRYNGDRVRNAKRQVTECEQEGVMLQQRLDNYNNRIRSEWARSWEPSEDNLHELFVRLDMIPDYDTLADFKEQVLSTAYDFKNVTKDAEININGYWVRVEHIDEDIDNPFAILIITSPNTTTTLWKVDIVGRYFSSDEYCNRKADAYHFSQVEDIVQVERVTTTTTTYKYIDV